MEAYDKPDYSLFGSVQEALGWAYSVVNIPVMERSNTLRGLLKHDRQFDGVFTPTIVRDLTGYERTAQASMIVALMYRHCRQGWVLVETFYMRGRSKEAAGRTREMVAEQFGWDRWYCEDVVRAWSGRRPIHSDRWWADKHGLSQSAIHRRSRKVRVYLDESLQRLFYSLDGPMRETGVVG